MGNVAPRLGYRTSSEEEPDWQLTTKTVDEIVSDECFGAHIAEDAQLELDVISRRYLLLRQAELGAPMLSEAYEASTRLKSAVHDFIKLCDGNLFSEDAGNVTSDARRAVQAMFFDGLDDAPIGLEKRDLEPRYLDPWQSEGGAPAGELNVSESFLGRLSQSLRIGLSSMDAALAGAAGFRPGDAFKGFADDLSEWARTNDYPCNAGSDSTPSAFVRLIVKLNETFPDNLRQRRLTEESMVRRLNRYRAREAT